ncbi:MAG: VOC family protein [Thermodesulfobacteriota bacterium]|jgi:catechol 2,3-dioxygenase-like lactoylglutathione lyase family enzyme
MEMNEMIVKLRHIGIIVKDAEKSVELFKYLFDLTDDKIKVVPPSVTKNESVFAFVPAGGIELELIQPISEHFKEMVGNPAEGINHIAFTVKDIEEAVKLMEQKGVRLGHVTKDGILDMGRSKVAYFNPEDTGGILIEFVEPKE